jgi:hypothetical protein
MIEGAITAYKAAEVASPHTTVANKLAALDELTKDDLHSKRPWRAWPMTAQRTIARPITLDGEGLVISTILQCSALREASSSINRCDAT